MRQLLANRPSSRYAFQSRRYWGRLSADPNPEVTVAKEAPGRAMTDRTLPVKADDVAPDGSHVRLLAGASRGGMAHFELGVGETSVAQQHRTVEEIWFVVDGMGEMWREPPDGPARVIELRPGVSLTIPVG